MSVKIPLAVSVPRGGIFYVFGDVSMHGSIISI